MAAPGRLITFEGIDGGGKSTQARRLASALEEAGARVRLTREPGGTEGAEEIRRLLTEGAPERWSPETECLLFTAARRDHLERLIAPALAAGETVISDRFVDSTRVYQGAVRGDLRAMVDKLHALAIGREADLTFILDLPAERAAARIAGADGGRRFEAFGLQMQARLREGFLALARAAPGRCHVIDAGRDADEIAAGIAAIALSPPS